MNYQEAMKTEIFLLLITAAVPAVVGNPCPGTAQNAQSNNLNATDLLAWQLGFDAMGGLGWDQCGDLSHRNNPCSCNHQGDKGFVCCSAGTAGTARITNIILQNNNVTGILPPEWSTLSEIQGIELHGNTLTGPLPDEWGILTKLHYLDLTDNDLSGTLPAWNKTTMRCFKPDDGYNTCSNAGSNAYVFAFKIII